jgi:hypothetical protein
VAEEAAGRKAWPGALLIVGSALLALTAVAFHRLDAVIDHPTAHGLTVYPVVLLAAGLIGVHARLRPGRVAIVGLVIGVLGCTAVVAGAVTARVWEPAPAGQWGAYHGSLFLSLDGLQSLFRAIGDAVFVGGRAVTGWQTLAALAADGPGWLVAVGGMALWAAASLRSGVIPRAGGFLIVASVPVGVAVRLLAGERPYALAWADVALAVTLGLGMAAVGRRAMQEGLAPRPDWRSVAAAGGTALVVAGFALGLPAGQRFGPLHRHPIQPPGKASFELVASCRPAAPGEGGRAEAGGTEQNVVETTLRWASAWPQGSFRDASPVLGMAWEPKDVDVVIDYRASRLEDPPRSPRFGRPGIPAPDSLLTFRSQGSLAETAASRWGAEMEGAGRGVATQSPPNFTVMKGRGSVVLVRRAAGPQAPPPAPFGPVRLTAAFFDVDGWRIERSAEVTC